MKKIKYKELSIPLQNYIGVDEVGRGCLAGPVVSSAVYIKKAQIGEIEGIYDSKKVSKTKREKLYLKIIQQYHYHTVFIPNQVIDRINIHQASLLAMSKAVNGLGLQKTLVLVDGIFKIPNIVQKQECFKRGDENFYSIAVASIIAKVERDEYMKKISKKYEEYGFDQHKGYGTKQHKEAIQKFGIKKIHRKSFNLS